MTLLKSIKKYAFVRVFTGIVGLAQTLLLIRLLVPEDYGKFSAIFAAGSLVNVLSLHWVAKSVARFGDLTDAEVEHQESLLNKLVSMHLICACAMLWISCLLAYFLNSSEISLVGLFVASESVKESSLEKARANHQARIFGAMQIRGGVAFLIAIAFLQVAMLDVHSLVAIYCGINILIFSPYWLQGAMKYRGKAVDFQLLRYGYPASLADGVGQVAYSGVRLYINALFGPAALGVYAAIYDLIQKTVVAYMQIIHTSGFPIIRKLWDRGAIEDMRRTGRSHMFALCFPAFVLLGMYMAGMNILLTSPHQSNGSQSLVVIVLVGLGVIINRLRSFYTDYFMLLSMRPSILLLNSSLSMVPLFIIGLVWRESITLYGVAGAVLFSYILGLIFSVFQSRPYFDARNFLCDFVICASPLIGFALIVGFSDFSEILNLVVGVAASILVIFVLAVFRYSPLHYFRVK